MAGYRSITTRPSCSALLDEVDEVLHEREPGGGGLLGVELGGVDVAVLHGGDHRPAVVAGGDDVIRHRGRVAVDEVHPDRIGQAVDKGGGPEHDESGTASGRERG